MTKDEIMALVSELVLTTQRSQHDYAEIDVARETLRTAVEQLVASQGEQASAVNQQAHWCTRLAEAGSNGNLETGECTRQCGSFSESKQKKPPTPVKGWRASRRGGSSG